MALGPPPPVAEAVVGGAELAPDACDTADAAFDELELELPHAASIAALSRTSAAPTPRLPITRPNPDITNPLLSRHSRSRTDIREAITGPRYNRNATERIL
jgi:hypothetical protein